MRRRAHIRRSYRAEVHSPTQLWFGIVAVLAGILLTLDNLGFIDARLFFRWWPALFIWAGINLAVRKDRPLAGSIFALLGLFLLLDNLNYIDLDFSDLWPLVLILLGVKIIWRHREERDGEDTRSGANPDGSVPSSGGEERSTGWTSEDATINAVAILGGVDRKCSSQRFKGGQLTSVMGRMRNRPPGSFDRGQPGGDRCLCFVGWRGTDGPRRLDRDHEDPTDHGRYFRQDHRSEGWFGKESDPEGERRHGRPRGQ